MSTPWPLRSFVAVSPIALVAVLLPACSSTSSDGPSGGGPASASVDAGAEAGVSSSDGASTSTGATSGASCEGACRTTTLTVSFGGKSRPLTRAQFGLVKGVVHLEAHDGGSTACPTKSSPSPDRTLVVEDLALPAAASATPVGTADGVRAAFFDFEGSLLPSTPMAKATDVKLVPMAVVKTGGAVTALAFEVTMAFPQGGTLTGHAYAEHCASMDE